MTSTDRARLAYDTFRDGLKDPRLIPHWDDAPSWVRDAVLVSYLQGKLDGPNAPAQRAPATGSLLEEAWNRYPQTGGTHRQAFIEGAQWAAVTSTERQSPLPEDGQEEMLKSIADLMEQIETLREAVNAVLNWYGNDRLIAFPGKQLVEALGSTDASTDRKCWCGISSAGRCAVCGTVASSSTDGGGK